MKLSFDQRWYWPSWTPRRSIAKGSSIPLSTSSLLDANGEYLHLFGTVRWADSGSHTVSSSGGKIGWFSGSSVTWTNASGELRVGLQDLSGTTTPMRGDGTFDVYRALTTSSDSISSNTWYESAMTSGTKTLADGDFVVIAEEIIAGGGASFRVTGTIQENDPTQGGFPGGALNTGTPATAGPAGFYLIADDGTYGWIEGTLPGAVGGSNEWTTSASPDEYAITFNAPHALQVDRIMWAGTLRASTSVARFRIYEDPLGTPNALATVTVDGSTHLHTTTSTLQFWTLPITSTILKPGQTYALAVASTGAGAIRSGRFEFNTAGIMQAFFGAETGMSSYSRNNDSGAFGSEVNNHHYTLALGVNAVYPRVPAHGFVGIGMGG